MAYTKDGITYRNLQEQVLYLTEKYQDLTSTSIVYQNLDIRIMYECNTIAQCPSVDEFKAYLEPFIEQGVIDSVYGCTVIIGTSQPYQLKILTRPTNNNPDDHYTTIDEWPARGSQGIQGNTGATGRSGTINVGQSFSINSDQAPRVTNTGTSNDAIFNFYIPKGLKGDTGSTGESIQQVAFISRTNNVDTYRVLGTNGTILGYINVTNGVNGTNGTDGKSLTFYGPVLNTGSLPSPSESYRGVAYLVGASAPYTVYVCTYDETEAGWYWSNQGTITQGPEGPQGPSGEGINTLISVNNSVLNSVSYSSTNGITATGVDVFTYGPNSTAHNVSFIKYFPIVAGDNIAFNVANNCITVSASGLVPNTRTVNGYPLSSDVTLAKSDIGLSLVENIAISTWSGSSNLTTCNKGTFGTAATLDYVDTDDIIDDEQSYLTPAVIPTVYSMIEYVSRSIQLTRPQKYLHQIYMQKTSGTGNYYISFSFVNSEVGAYSTFEGLRSALASAGFTSSKTLPASGGACQSAQSTQMSNVASLYASSTNIVVFVISYLTTGTVSKSNLQISGGVTIQDKVTQL